MTKPYYFIRVWQASNFESDYRYITHYEKKYNNKVSCLFALIRAKLHGYKTEHWYVAPRHELKKVNI